MRGFVNGGKGMYLTPYVTWQHGRWTTSEFVISDAAVMIKKKTKTVV